MSEVTAEMIERGRGTDPRTAAQRRRVAAQLKGTRAKLTSSGEDTRGFDIELLRQYAQTRQVASAGMTGLALVVGAISLLWVQPISALIWFSLIATGALLGYGFARRYLEVPVEDIDVQAWRRKFVLAEMINGSMWGLLVVMLLQVQEPDARTFVLFILLLVAAMCTMMSATVPRAVYSGLLPITLAIVIFMQVTADYHAIPLTIMAIVAQIYFIVLAKRMYQSTVASLALRMEKDSLIAELEQAKANSDEARRRAEEANLAKSRFLATMSHELRTPLNAILGFSEVMKGELFGEHSVPAYKNYSSDIHSSGQHLLALINEILDLSRVEAGRYELQEEPVSLTEVTEDCVRLLGMRAKSRSITIQSNLEKALPRIWADERAIRQITLNLLTNAIKFTPQGGAITVKAGWTGSGGQYLSIRDNGPGIPEEELPVVMSSFGRGTMALKNADEGSGLGLPIVKGLVELHGGQFRLKSKVRQGTEVTVIIPPQRVMDAFPQMNPESHGGGPDTSGNKPARKRRFGNAA